MVNKDIILKTQTIFKSIIKIDKEGNEYWLARELMPVLDYNRWKKFRSLIERAKISLSKNYPQIDDHFRETTKKIKVGAGTKKETMRKVIDYKLMRYACYLIAQNGDSSKNAIASAQNYFAQQTRKQELNDEKETKY